VDPQSDIKIPELIELSKQGDEQAFRLLYEHLNNNLFAFIVARTNSREGAKDVLQDVFVDLWRACQRFRYKSDKQFYAFVFTIARRRLIKYYRASQASVELSDQQTLDNYEEQVEYFPQLNEAVSGLNKKYQDVINLRYWSQMSFVEIADWLDITANTAKVRHHRALKHLQSLIKGYEE